MISLDVTSANSVSLVFKNKDLNQQARPLNQSSINVHYTGINCDLCWLTAGFH